MAKKFRRAARSLILFIVTLGVCEAALRVIGYEVRAGNLTKFDSMYTPDPETGWDNNPGKHAFARPDRKEIKYNFTICGDGSRAVDGRCGVGDKSKIYLIGDSFMQGGSLDDNEIFPFFLQNLRPDVQVVNHGVGGFGGCQSLLKLRGILPSDCGGDTVIYGLNGFHEERNVASPAYVWRLARASASRETHMPYCDAEKGALEYFPPERYAALDFINHSRLMQLCADAYYAIAGSGRDSRKRKVSEEIIKEMNRTVKNCGGALKVLLISLSDEARRSYAAFLTESGISYIDAIDARLDDPAFKIPNDGHPNSEIHRQWASLVQKNLEN